ncbi:[FeFe] hydrogenase H-cluster maturation GTPase HydF [Desulfofundulus thermosubterraneus]|uniref:Iron-only hydrogenase maturation protein HydF n=1 Tax=Desulfofundulus thermosubterraneus DSM 16057 TaxID=1121432 RepID=A0A1M6ENH9_9FIRM|nr:[FeFe] hydrogenase H-cluster maturation GTPase HydF [Desulfofundulus thermosubterraneus]SHI86994.1 iron-only hydrogenase maturation protein HydF [Desulfofundulus thermosubterraneus DSM 16057]
MSLNATPRGQRLHIALFGRRNAGKSSLINAITNQEVAIVSGIPGTTTDPVAKAMELLPLGPVMIIDTAGLDDTGELGALRVQKTLEVLNKTDLALLVVDPGRGIGEYERDVVNRAREQKVPVLGVINKIDLYPGAVNRPWQQELDVPFVAVSALTRRGINELKMAVVKAAPRDWALPTIVGDLIEPGDLVVLVIPIDKAAPRGRLILPQQQVIRDVLENDAVAVMVKERELKHALASMAVKPKLVVTDASAYLKAVADTPPDVLFTSFSILFARFKGDLPTLVAGARAVKDLKPGDKILIAEACTHHPIQDDIGRVKIPRWLRQAVGGELLFDVASGGSTLPGNLRDYKLIVHCGACMLNRREMLYRIMQAQEAGVPIVNYGVLMAHIHGVLKRALSPFPQALAVLEEEQVEFEDELALLQQASRT